VGNKRGDRRVVANEGICPARNYGSAGEIENPATAKSSSLVEPGAQIGQELDAKSPVKSPIFARKPTAGSIGTGLASLGALWGGSAG